MCAWGKHIFTQKLSILHKWPCESYIRKVRRVRPKGVRMRAGLYIMYTHKKNDCLKLVTT